MLCWFCKHPITIPAIRYPQDTTKVNDTVRKTVQRVPCTYCGAQFDIDTYLAKMPRLNIDQLKRLENKVGK